MTRATKAQPAPTPTASRFLPPQDLNRSVRRLQLDQRPAAANRSIQLLLVPAAVAMQAVEVRGDGSVRGSGLDACVRLRRQEDYQARVAGAGPHVRKQLPIDPQLDMAVGRFQAHRPARGG